MKAVVAASERVVPAGAAPRADGARTVEGGRDAFADCLDAASPRAGRDAERDVERDVERGRDRERAGAPARARAVEKAAATPERSTGASPIRDERLGSPRASAGLAERDDVRETPPDPKAEAGAASAPVLALLALASVVELPGSGASGSAPSSAPVGPSLEAPDIATLTGRSDVSLTVETVEAGASAAPAAPAAAAPAAPDGGLVQAHPMRDRDLSRGDVSLPAAVDPSASAPGTGAPDEVRVDEARAAAVSEPSELPEGDDAPARTGVVLDPVGTRPAEAGAEAHTDGDSPRGGEASGDGIVQESVSGDADEGVEEAPLDARFGPVRTAPDARTAGGQGPGPAALAAADVGGDEPSLPEVVGNLPGRIVVGVADRDGAWQMEIRRGDAGLDVLLRGDHAFVGAVRGVEGELRQALVGAGERDAHVRVDADASAGDPSRGGGRDGDARDSRATPPGLERDGRGGRGTVARRDSPVESGHAGVSPRGYRVDRIV